MNQLRTHAGNTVQIEVGPVVRDEASVDIASSTGTAPIEITTVGNHGYAAGDIVRVEEHTLNGKANGEHEIETIASPTRFTLKGTSGDRAGGKTGRVVRLKRVDLSLGGTKMWFTAKPRKAIPDSPAPALQKTELAGITLNSPSSTGNSKATIVVLPADTVGILKTTDYVWDVELEEPGGRRSTIAEGDWQILGSVTRT